MIGQKFRYQLNLCISDILHAINFMSDNGKQTKVIYLSKTASGVTQTIILHVTQAVRCLTHLTLTADNVILFVTHVGDLQNIIVSHVQIMELQQVFIKEELFALKSVETELS